LTKIEPQEDELLVEQTSMVPAMGAIILTLGFIQSIVAIVWYATTHNAVAVRNPFAQAAFLLIAAVVLLTRPVLRRTVLGPGAKTTWESKSILGKITRREGKATEVEIDVGFQWAYLYVHLDGRRHTMLTRTKMFTGERDHPELREQGTRIAKFVGLTLK